VARVKLDRPPFDGRFPVGVGVSPDGKYIYVANNNSLNISVVEAGRYGWRVVAEIPIGKLPSYIALTTDGRLAYVTLRNNNEIAVVDLLVNLPVKTIPAGTRPIGIAINEDYVGFATNGGSDDVTVFNAKLAEVSPVTIAVGDTPVSVAFNPEGDIAYVTNRLSNTVSVIDVFQHKVIATIPVGTQPVGIALTEEGRYSAVANVGEDTVSIIDNSKGTVIDTVAVGEFLFAIKIVTVRKWPGSHK
jgi:YVTN family beta-propeller protein